MGIAFREEARRFIGWRTITTESSLPFAQHLAQLMRELGLAVEVQETTAGGLRHANVLGALGTGPGGLLLATHFDTVPPGDPQAWTRTRGDPFAATIDGDRIYGLGAADAKLDLLAKLAAVQAIGRRPLSIPLTVVGTFGEESGMLGAQALYERRHVSPRFALVGEPSDLCLVTQHKGYLVLEVRMGCVPLAAPVAHATHLRFAGRAAHSSTPELGDNAILKACAWLTPLTQAAPDAMILSITGGSACNIVPAHCGITVAQAPPPLPEVADAEVRPAPVTARRGLPAVVLTDVTTEVARILQTWCGAHDAAFDPPSATWNLGLGRTDADQIVLTYDVRSLPAQDSAALVAQCRAGLSGLMRRHPAISWGCQVERNNPPLAARPGGVLLPLAEAALRDIGVLPRVISKPSCSEAPVFQALGAEVLVVGAGPSRGNVHAPNEYNHLSQLDQAVAFYRLMIERVCRSP